MSTVELDDRGGSPIGAAVGGAPRATGRSAPATPALLRLTAFSALALFCLLHWSALVIPAAGSELAAVVVCVAAGLGLIGCGALAQPARTIVAVLIAVSLLASVLLVVGTPFGLLDHPHGLSALVGFIGGGLGTLPNVHVPYNGIDEWTRRTIELGGPALLALATLAAFWPARGARPAELGPGRRTLAVACIVALYATAALNLKGDAEFVRGGLFFVLLAGFLGLERLRRTDLGAATTLAVVAALASIVAAPLLQGSRPWLDYEGLSRSLQTATGEQFNWNQRYGPLDWPRDGRVVLEVKTSTPTYWKAEALTVFDGREWIEDPSPRSVPVSTELPSDPGVRARFTQQMRVTVGSMRSQQFIGAGVTTAITGAPRQPLEGASVGSFRAAGDGLHRGHSYQATVYAPQPTQAQLAGASSTAYDAHMRQYLRLAIPARAPVSLGGGSYDVQDASDVAFSAFEPGTSASAVLADGSSAEPLLTTSVYRGAWALASRLRASSTSPADFVRRVRAYLSRGFTYSEDTPARAVPLERFLFVDHRGYCQQFSGAMALLLRMGGIPARVATGFTTGNLDRTRQLYSVTDADAHAWVEAWFVGLGWVPFDPTPATAPARGGSGVSGAATPRDRPPQPPPPSHSSLPAAPAASTPHSGSSWVAVAVGLALALLLAAVAAAIVGSRRRRLQRSPERLVSELRRLLAACGAERAGLTLRSLEQVVARSPVAVRYIRALAVARYGNPRDGEQALAPELVRRGRLALRRELTRRASARTKLRALLASSRPGLQGRLARS